MSPAQKIRIEDLHDPILTDGQKAALAFGESNPVELSVDAVQKTAVERTGLKRYVTFAGVNRSSKKSGP